MQIQLPEKVSHIIATLVQSGHQAYAVGGCIRDSVLGRIPQDWDITTSAKPYEVKALFPKTIDTGIQHGTVTVMVQQEGFEVTTYRVDGVYEDYRRPKQVTFTPDLTEDLKRRDFTINAMAYNPKDGLVDVFGGIEDLKSGIVRCVGDPYQRFDEDALRMMRAVRFAAQLGFSIEGATKEAVQKLSGTLCHISAERIQAELTKLLLSGHPEEMRTLYQLGVTSVMLPEFDEMMGTKQDNPHHAYTVGEHTIEALLHTPCDKVLRLAVLLHDVAKPSCRKRGEDGMDHFYGHPQMGSRMAEGILKRLKYDNDTIDKVCRLVMWHDDNPPLSQKSIRRAVVRLGQEAYPAVFAVKRADILAQSSYKRDEKLQYLKGYEDIYNKILEQQDCLTLKDLAVNGRDLITAGFAPGPGLGKVLNGLLEIVLEDPQKNKKEYLLSQAAKI
ncbi:CCA tRNA nucleotidyltransferase [Lachnospiraceae bacterium]|nr:CCA tRNA nucleotidyltransferase [Lachnospiraceae bacterium]